MSAASTSASASPAPSVQVQEVIDFSVIKQVIPQLAASELLETIVLCTKELAKNGKALQKMEKSAGVRPQQLEKSTRWVDVVLQDAKENGWEPFEMPQKVKDKLTGEKETVVVQMSRGVMGSKGVYVYEGMTQGKGEEKTFNLTDAMSLSKKLKEENSQLWQDFSAGAYSDEVEAPAAKAKPARAKISAEEAERLKEEKARVAAEAKAEKARAAEEAKAEKKRLAELKKEEEKAAKAAATKVKAPQPLKITLTRPATPPPTIAAPAEAAAAAAPAEAAAAAAPAPAPKKVVKKVVKMEEEEVWVARPDAEYSEWKFDGKVYFRNSEDKVWEQNEGGQTWVGMYIPAEKRIDTDAAEPVEDEEDEE